MNGVGAGYDGGVKMEEVKERLVFMWGYLPGALPQRALLLSPVAVRLPSSIGSGCSWKDVCGGGCGFAMAISGSLFVPDLFCLFLVFCLLKICVFLCSDIGSGNAFCSYSD
ncbi:hypothetical protein U1Q18_036051 [Sarracenia purpurea var. burkii]